MATERTGNFLGIGQLLCTSMQLSTCSQSAVNQHQQSEVDARGWLLFS